MLNLNEQKGKRSRVGRAALFNGCFFIFFSAAVAVFFVLQLQLRPNKVVRGSVRTAGFNKRQ